MSKMTKEQTARFDTLFETTLTWGEGETCTGLFEEFGGANEYLATCIEDGYLQILKYRGSWWTLMYTIPINRKAKTYMKKLVEHLMSNDLDTFKF